VPDEAMNRPKMGFSIPLSRWFRGELKGMFEERVFAPGAFLQDYLDPRPIRQWWDHHQRGLRDYSNHLWALLVLECWGQRFVKGRG
jgi:asparagine synthase (glutamine-hydrolysing)